jgi:hypothetical protein
MGSEWVSVPEVKSHVAEGFLSGVIQNSCHIDELLEKIEGAIRS